MPAPSAFRRNLPALAIALSLAFAAFSVYIVFAWYHPMPFQDAWGMVPQYRWLQEGTLPASVFWETHNEHKIPVLRLLFLADYALARGTGYLLITLSLLLQAAHVLLIHQSLRRAADISPRDRVFLACAALVTAFWLVQSGNFTWNFQVAWFLNAFAASLAAYAVCSLRADVRGAANARRLAGAALCVALAAMNVANGLLLCVVLLPVLWKARLPRRFLVAWILFSAALFAAYFLGPEPRDGAPGGGLRLEAFYYLLAYLGNPVTRFSAGAGMLLGGAGLLAFLVFARRTLAAPRPGFFDGFAFIQLAYVVVTGAVTAVGRNGLGIEQAGSSRYYTTVLLFWLFLFFLAWRRWANHPRARSWVRGGALAVLALFVLPVQALSVPQRAARYLKADEAALALVSGVADTTTLHYACGADSVTWGEGAYLKAQRLSIFTQPWTHAPGQALSTWGVIESGGSATLEESLQPVGEAPRKGQYLRGRIETGAVPEVVFFARGDSVVGVARTRGRGCRGCFTGYARSTAGDAPLEIFALEGGRLRRLDLSPIP